MCGIIGYTGNREAAPILLDCLARLEYRGYDSAGIATLSQTNTIIIRKASGKLNTLLTSLNGVLPPGKAGIGHTRWATHGIPNEPNAQPHQDCQGELIVVHNGIVENYLELKKGLLDQGHVFSSETDSEVIPHLIENLIAEGLSLKESTRQTALKLDGAHAVVVMYNAEPENILAFRVGNAGGIVVGYNDCEMLLGSDLAAIIPYTQQVAFLSAHEMVSLTPSSASYYSLQGSHIEKETRTVPYDAVSIAKGEHKHFMLKEIMEQPEAVISTLSNRVSFDPWSVHLEDIHLTKSDILDINRVVFTAMGTSFHAAMIARHMMEKLSGLPSEAENASEFRYREPIIDSNTLVVSIGQSGETADTLSAMEEASGRGARLITICNVEESAATRLAEGCIYLRSGPEIGVASTKTFLCSLEALYILSAYIGVQRGFLSEHALRKALGYLALLPDLIGKVIADHKPYMHLAELYHKQSNFLYLGRGINYPVALEGALKLKEISYIHAEGCPAGEMKHGPIALIDENMPVVTIVPRDNLHDKMLNTISEVKTRGGIIIAIATEGDEEVAKLVDHVIYIPEVSPLLTPMLTSVPLQMLAYYIAIRRGCDVDQPRNLAKTVTVE